MLPETRPVPNRERLRFHKPREASGRNCRVLHQPAGGGRAVDNDLAAHDLGIGKAHPGARAGLLFEGCQAAGVIGVAVGDDDVFDVARAAAEGLDRGENLHIILAIAGVDQGEGASVLDQEGIDGSEAKRIDAGEDEFGGHGGTV